MAAIWYRGSLAINTIACVATTENYALMWIERHRQKKVSLCIRAHTIYTPTPNISYDKLLYNPSQLYRHIMDFITTHRIKNPSLSFALSTDAIRHHSITSHNHDTQSITTDMDGATWYQQIHYLYPTDDHQHVFYIHAINRAALLQYTLVALRTHLHLVAITTAPLALIELYKILHQGNFRQATFAHDMQQYNNTLANYFTREHLAQITGYQMNTTAEELFLLSVGAGLALKP